MSGKKIALCAVTVLVIVTGLDLSLLWAPPTLLSYIVWTSVVMLIQIVVCAIGYLKISRMRAQPSSLSEVDTAQQQ